MSSRREDFERAMVIMVEHIADIAMLRASSRFRQLSPDEKLKETEHLLAVTAILYEMLVPFDVGEHAPPRPEPPRPPTQATHREPDRDPRVTPPPKSK